MKGWIVLHAYDCEGMGAPDEPLTVYTSRKDAEERAEAINTRMVWGEVVEVQIPHTSSSMWDEFERTSE